MGAENHSWMSQSNYGGTDKDAEPKANINYGEAGQNMEGDLPETPVTDDDLRRDVLLALKDDMHVDDSNISVVVNYGEVRLSGTVTQRAMLNAAEECVKSVPGVMKINNELKIQVV